jgi:DNA-binding response OmpR family regulator
MKRILIVDDEPAIARLVKMSLSVEGYDAVTATSGFEALERVEEKKPDLVILDIMMPGMNGYEVCTQLKSKPETKNIHVVFLSARGDSGDPQRAFVLGADDYIIKPFDPDELLEKVKNLLGPGI